jgi:hypothetical protein
MSDENNEAGQAVPAAESAPAAKPAEMAASAGGIVANLKSNPKVLYVAGGAAVVVALLLMMSGGGGEQAKMIASIAPGQTVTITNPNGGDTQLNALPTLVSVAQTEEDEKQIVCRVSPGTQATVLEERYDGMLSFVRLQVKEGPCQGNSGWAPKVNIK